MKTYPYVEDYLEVINGDRDPVTGKVYGLFSDTPPIISLARYDVQIINSMSTATLDGKSLTDKQADLAVKIILKYRKQLEKLVIDVSPIESPEYRLGIRQIDRRQLLYIEDNKIVLKFPYDTKLIDDIRDLAKISQGQWNFVPDPKIWQLAITETNVVASHGFATNHQFEISDEFKTYLNEVLECEKNNYEIKLVEEGGQFSITNAAPSLIEAIKNYCGFHLSNIDLLVDNSPIYGYSIDQNIENKIIAKYSPRIYNLMSSLESKFNPTVQNEVAKDIVDYANITNRYPIYVYEPNLSGHLLNGFVNQYFESDEIYRATDLKKEPITVNKKVIYFHKFSASWTQPIPLLVSGQGMMHGGEKSMLLQRAKKVVYFAAEVYNNKKFKNS